MLLIQQLRQNTRLKMEQTKIFCIIKNAKNPPRITNRTNHSKCIKETRKHILKTAKENQENPKGRVIVTIRFRLSAIELLVTNRYLDEEYLFYRIAEEMFNQILTGNDQLNIWENFSESTEKWFLDDDNQKAFKLIKKFMKKLINAQKKLEVSC